MREKLIELVKKKYDHYIENLADYLIANGVRINEWIPVSERLPEPYKLVLCLWKDTNGIHYGLARYQRDDIWYVSNEGMPEVTDWMPLPELPRE